jgi:hypothetical protein
MLFVYGVQGLGVLAVGPRDYMARGCGDGFGYVSMTQFLMDVPLSTDWEDVGQRAYLAEAFFFKGKDRLGAEIVLGFCAASLGTAAKPLFGPVILLGPAYVVLAVYGLARHLGRGKGSALATGVAAGLLPGLAALHLYSFLAHTLAIPLILACLLSLHALATGPSPGRLLRTVLLLAGTLAIYTEMGLLLAGLAGVVLAGGMLLRTLGVLRGLGLALALPVLTLACNPLCLKMYYWVALGRANIPTDTNCSLGWGYCWRGLGGLWVNETWAFDDVMRQRQALVLGVALTILAVAGLVCLGGRWLGLSVRARRGDVVFRGRCVLVAGILALALVPLYVWSKGLYVYQFLKLTVRVSLRNW